VDEWEDAPAAETNAPGQTGGWNGAGKSSALNGTPGWEWGDSDFSDAGDEVGERQIEKADETLDAAPEEHVTLTRETLEVGTPASGDLDEVEAGYRALAADPEEQLIADQRQANREARHPQDLPEEGWGDAPVAGVPASDVSTSHAGATVPEDGEWGADAPAATPVVVPVTPEGEVPRVNVPSGPEGELNTPGGVTPGVPAGIIPGVDGSSPSVLVPGYGEGLPRVSDAGMMPVTSGNSPAPLTPVGEGESWEASPDKGGTPPSLVTPAPGLGGIDWDDAPAAGTALPGMGPAVGDVEFEKALSVVSGYVPAGAALPGIPVGVPLPDFLPGEGDEDEVVVVDGLEVDEDDLASGHVLTPTVPVPGSGSDDTVEGHGGESPVKRGRGRPKGSTNKAKVSKGGGNKLGGIRLTARDMKILSFLARYRIATVGQMARMFDTSETALRNRLPGLNKAGLISWAWAAQTKPKVWLITDSGLATVGMNLTVPTVKWGQLRHTLGLVDLGVMFETAGEIVLTEREIRAAATRYTPTNRMKTAIGMYQGVPSMAPNPADLALDPTGLTGRVRSALTVPVAGSAYGHIPDMVLVRQPFPNGSSGNIAIELELTRKSLSDWNKIIGAFRDSNTFSEVYYFVMSKEIQRGLMGVVKALNAEHKVKIVPFTPVDLTADPTVTGGGD
jgi:hypothetical protein